MDVILHGGSSCHCRRRWCVSRDELVMAVLMVEGILVAIVVLLVVVVVV